MTSADRPIPDTPPVQAPSPPAALRPVPRTGVIYVTAEASARGYRAGHPDWCNLGQGMPEIGALDGASPRVAHVEIDPADHEYAPVAGVWELREAVAELYNGLYRRGMGSRYSAENVAIASGGRASLTRVVASLAQVNLGHFLPDYTAYEELLDIFRLVSPIPILLSREEGYSFSRRELEREIVGRGLGALLMSNPNNPMGKLVSGQTLADWIGVARQLDCTLVLDEFYSHYVWTPELGEPGPTVSAARWVEDVEKDPVIVLDGLTKNWRYPGWRVTWTLGPRRVIEAIESAGSFLDGGGSKPLQRAAVELMNPERVLHDSAAVRAAFADKRSLVLSRLADLGLTVDREPDGTFYAFVSLDGLPAGLRDGLDFFRAALDRQVVTVPGLFFDVNPGHRRAERLSRFHNRLRLSFGPPRAEVERGLDRLEAMIDAAR
ncbi:MAG: pyridoxal phosphate-dependent aminotransferase [Acidobacteriota bacterium]